MKHAAVELASAGLTLGALKDIFRRCDLMLTNATGPRHIAAAMDVLAGRRMNASVIGLRSGGFDGRLLQESGAYRVYADPRELSESLEQLGFEP